MKSHKKHVVDNFSYLLILYTGFVIFQIPKLANFSFWSLLQSFHELPQQSYLEFQTYPI